MSTQHDQWRTLEREALAVLRSDVRTSLGPGFGRSRRLFQILTLPSFAPAVAWNVCVKESRTEGRKYFALCSKWRKDVDADKFGHVMEWLKHRGNAQPTFEHRLVEIEGGFAESFMERLRSIKIPAYAPTEMVGTDGTSYEIAVGNGFADVRYHWWGPAPEGWLLLGELIVEAIEYLEARPPEV